MLIYVSGGARSGKSSFAERLAIDFCQQARAAGSSTSRLWYVATAQALDHEMQERIALHRRDRSENHEALKWNTIEEPFYLKQAIQPCQAEDIILLDCLTLWVSNMLYHLQLSVEDLKQMLDELVDYIRERHLKLIMVSNDINEDVPVHDPMVQEYVQGMGKLHQELVRQADLAVQVIAGIPVVWKDVR